MEEAVEEAALFAIGRFGCWLWSVFKLGVALLNVDWRLVDSSLGSDHYGQGLRICSKFWVGLHSKDPPVVVGGQQVGVDIFVGEVTIEKNQVTDSPFEFSNKCGLPILFVQLFDTDGEADAFPEGAQVLTLFIRLDLGGSVDCVFDPLFGP